MPLNEAAIAIKNVKIWERKKKGSREEDKGAVGQGKGRLGVALRSKTVPYSSEVTRVHPSLDLDNPHSGTSLSRVNLREFKKFSTIA